MIAQDTTGQLKPEQHSDDPKISGSLTEIAEAFTEWERRFREDPESYMSEAAKLLKETPETYGQACAPYFALILGEVQKKKAD